MNSNARLQKIVLATAGLCVVLGLFLWQALPRIVQDQLEKFVTAQTGHRLIFDHVEFDPFALALRLSKLELATPDGQPLLTCDGVLVDVSAASFVRRALVFDALHLEKLTATLIELPEGGLNWLPFIEALKSKNEKAGKLLRLPRFEIGSFILSSGRIDFGDRHGLGAGFATRIEPLELKLSDLSTIAEKDGGFVISALTSLGARIALAGRIDLDPLTLTGKLELADLQLTKLSPYLRKTLPLPVEGVLDLAAHFEAGSTGTQFDFTLKQMQAKLSNVHIAREDGSGLLASVDEIELKDGRWHWSGMQLALASLTASAARLVLPGIEQPPRFAALTLEDIQANLRERRATVGRIRLAGGSVWFKREADGKIDLQEALYSLFNSASVAGKAQKAAEEAAPSWRFKVGRLDLANLDLIWQDASLQPTLVLALDKLAVRAEGLSEDMRLPVPVQLSFDVQSGGHFEAAGQVVPATPSAAFDFRLSGLSLKPAQPLLSQRATLVLADGTLSAQGRALYDGRGPVIEGTFALRDLRLIEPGSEKPMLAWQLLDGRHVSLTPRQLDLGELTLQGLTTQLLIDKDKSINVMRVMKPAGAENGPFAAGKSGTLATAKTAQPAFTVAIERLHLHSGALDFADHSLLLPFATHIHGLHGSLVGVSNQPGTLGQIELKGQVDDYGMARAVGRLDTFHPSEALDMQVQFRNIEMTRLSPYTATFAGRRIDSGKLSIDLHYQIGQRKLVGESQVVMDELILGERIASPQAKDLPLDFAIALLKDADGRIDLGLPVSGSLDDPEFSFGALVWKAITNVISRIVSAPFRALGALFAGGEPPEHIAFEFGSAELTPPEREKLMRLAAAFVKRPGLKLSVAGSHAEADRVALQEVQLRRAVLLKAGQQVPEHGDPGLLSTSQPKIRAALEALYEERIGAAELAALKEGFRRANPGQLEKALTGSLFSRLSGLLREKKTLSADEIDKLKGADFYAVLYERLRARENVPAERLQALAAARSAVVIETLSSAGIAAERLEVLPLKAASPEEVSRGKVPLELKLEPLNAN